MKLSVQGKAAYAYTGGKPFDPSLPCLTLVHGAMGDHGVWNLLARWFAHHGRSVLAVDLPGHMRTAGPALATVEAHADWLMELLQAVGVKRTSLAGHSMGSLIALEAASRAKAPVTVDRLVMLGTSVPMPVPQALLDLGRTDMHAAIDRVVSFSFSTLAGKPSFPGPGVWLHGADRQLMRMVAARSGDPLLFHTDFLACHQYARGLEAAAQVTCPAHLVLGNQDQMTMPRGAAEVARVLKATVHTVPAGHMMMQEAPDEVLAAMRKALG